MPTGRRIRSACQVCHARGQYQRLEITISWEGVARLYFLTFCAPCRAYWLDMTVGRKGLQSGGHLVDDVLAASAIVTEFRERSPRSSRRTHRKPRPRTPQLAGPQFLGDTA